MPYYPVFLDLRGKKVLVVGGGPVAERKIETFLEFGASVHVISRELTPVLEKHVEKGLVRFEGPEFRESVLDGAFLVVAATDDFRLNRHVSRHAKERAILVNAVDQPDDCSFVVPSILRRGDLIIAVSTSGRSPALARAVRERLEQVFGDEYESFLVLMGEIRKEILSRALPQEEKGRIFRELVKSSLLDAFREKDWKSAVAILERITGRGWSEKELLSGVRGK